MKKTLKIILLCLKFNLLSDLMYRSSLIYYQLSNFTYVFAFVFALKFIFNYVPEIYGYGYDQMYVILLLGQLWWFFNSFMVRGNFQYVARAINQGTLDFHLIKPIKFRPLIPSLQVDFRFAPTIIIAIFLLFLKIDLADLTLGQWLTAVFFFFNGIFLMYSFTSIFTSLTFWTGRNNAIFDITIELPELVKMPIVFFPLVFKIFFTFVIPVTLMVNPTFEIMHHQASYPLLALALAMSTGIFLISEIIWQKGVERYSSAG